MHEPLNGLFSDSKLLILDFTRLPSTIPKAENIQLYFEASLAKGINPRLPKHRQAFNEQMLAATNMRYLVSRYAEDRIAMLEGSQIAREGRTYHLGIDIFAKDLETVYAPCDGEIVRVGQEPEDHSYGYYAIIRPEDRKLPYIFLGHLSAKLPQVGRITAGQPIARLGDFVEHENGGWSRHLHIQMINKLPPEGETPPGYSSAENLVASSQAYPNPFDFFPAWNAKHIPSRSSLESATR